MRIIAGKYRRRVLHSLEGQTTRPMLDRVRETLFNILQLEVPGAIFADLFAGTGAVGIEALSRGARRAIFVEQNPKAAQVIDENLRLLGAREDGEIRMSPVTSAIPSIEADIYFLGPPYAATGEYAATLNGLAERNARLAIAQHASKLKLDESYGALKRQRVVKIGASSLSFFRQPGTDEG